LALATFVKLQFIEFMEFIELRLREKEIPDPAA